LSFGKPTGAATPLLWAHAEYVKLLRSTLDGKVFDTIPVVAERYSKPRSGAQIEVWKQDRRVTSAQAGATLRIQATTAFLLHWTVDDWQSVNDTRTTSIPLGSEFVDIRIGVEFVDIPITVSQRAPIRFTFFWLNDERWEGRDYAVQVGHDAAEEGSSRSSTARQEDRAASRQASKRPLVVV
jgi:glucoamylase